MGRGYGGYTEAQPSYKDSGGHKVTDNGAIFVAERWGTRLCSGSVMAKNLWT